MSQISAATSIDSALSGPVNRFSELESEDFIRIIFTELTNQDPLQPNDTGALLDQLNSIRSIESDLQLTKQLESLVTENQLASSANMIGKVVEGLSDELNRVVGVVTAARREGDEVKVELDDGSVVPVKNIESVYELPVGP